jgi:hypothetical protein
MPHGYRWIGGANLPTRGGWRVNATAPFAAMSLKDGVVRLELRGSFLTRLFRAVPLQVDRSGVQSVFPVRYKLPSLFLGVV